MVQNCNRFLHRNCAVARLLFSVLRQLQSFDGVPSSLVSDSRMLDAALYLPLTRVSEARAARLRSCLLRLGLDLRRRQCRLAFRCVLACEARFVGSF